MASIVFDDALDREIERHLPEALRGQRKVRIRAEHVAREWLRGITQGNGAGQGLPSAAGFVDNHPAREGRSDRESTKARNRRQG